MKRATILLLIMFFSIQLTSVLEAQTSDIFASSEELESTNVMSRDSLKSPSTLSGGELKNSQSGGKELKKADELYDDYGYKASVDVYHNLSKKEKNNMRVLAKMANSYRLNHETEEAEYWYSKFVHQTDDSKHFLHFAQVLQSNGKCEDAVRWYKKYKDNAPRKDRENRDFIKDCSEEDDFKENETVTIVNEEKLNSDHLDFSPIPYKDGFVFTSTRGVDRMTVKRDIWTKDNFSDLFVANLNEDGKLENPKPLFGDINGLYHDGTATFNLPGSLMIFTRNNNDGKSKKGLIDLKIYSARKDDKDKYWGNITELPFNSDEFTSCHPTLSNDGRRLYFASNRPGGYGGLDLYISYSEGGSWSEPKNLGPTVNSSGNELFPFINEEEELYYASNGHKGLGGLDIFMAKKVDKEDEESWSIRDNMGKKFNTKKDDFGFWISPDKTHGYLSSSRKDKKRKGEDDIYKWVSDSAPGLGGYARTICVHEDGTSKRIAGASVTIVENTPSYTEDGSMSVEDRHLILTLKPVDQKDDEYVLGLKQQHLKDTNKAIKETDENGVISHRIQPDKDYVLLVEKNGYLLSKEVVKGKEIINNTEYCVPIKRIGAGCKMLNGLVKNRDYDKVLANAKVKIKDKCKGEEKEYITGPDGAFSYCIECGCEYEVRASKSGLDMDIEFLSTMQADCKPGETVNTVLKLGKRKIVKTEPAPAPATPVTTPAPNPNPPVRYVPKTTYVATTTYVPKTTYVPTTTYVPAYEMTPDMLNNHFLGDPNAGFAEGMLIDIKDIYYNFDKADIRLDASLDLDRIVQLMRTYSTMEISMESHTDSRGTAMYNKTLSANRAKEARAYIISKGIEPHRLTAQGFGEDRLTNKCGDGVNCSEAEHQSNRRTEIRITRFDQ